METDYTVDLIVGVQTGLQSHRAMSMVQESEEIRIAAKGLELLGSPPRAKHGCRGFTICTL